MDLKGCKTSEGCVEMVIPQVHCLVRDSSWQVLKHRQGEDLQSSFKKSLVVQIPIFSIHTLVDHVDVLTQRRFTQGLTSMGIYQSNAHIIVKEEHFCG